jgi:hypothetical protein
MSPVTGIRNVGFRAWYERELIEGHLYLVTCVFSAMLLCACMEALDLRGPGLYAAFMIACIALGAWGCWFSFNRYRLILARAEDLAGQSTCTACSCYGRLTIVEAGRPTVDEAAVDAAAAWLRVKCGRCGHVWRMDNTE